METARTVKDVSPHEFVKAYSAHLKRSGKVLSVVGLLQDDVDLMVTVMKVEKAPLESYADIG